MIRKKFYHDGLLFGCQGDGKCCKSRGEYGYVYLSFNDRRRLAAHFKITLRQFTEQYAEKEDGRYQLKYADKDCPFFGNNQCMVYPSRPWQCRTWPFWPENMRKSVWESEVAGYCPGIGKGRVYSAEEIEEILAKKKDVSGTKMSATPFQKKASPA